MYTKSYGCDWVKWISLRSELTPHYAGFWTENFREAPYTFCGGEHISSPLEFVFHTGKEFWANLPPVLHLNRWKLHEVYSGMWIAEDVRATNRV